MASLLIDSKAKGDWWYEVEEDKVKINYRIKFGFNEIPESHVKVLEKNPGFKLKLGRLYKVLKRNEIKPDVKDTKALDEAKKASEAKDLYKQKISELKEEHKTELKKEKELYKIEFQKLTDSRGEALRQVKDLEGEKVNLSGQLAELEAKSKKELEISTDEFNELIKGLEKELSDLKVSSEKKIKSLEGEKKALENKIKAK